MFRVCRNRLETVRVRSIPLVSRAAFAILDHVTRIRCEASVRSVDYDHRAWGRNAIHRVAYDVKGDPVTLGKVGYSQHRNVVCRHDCVSRLERSCAHPRQFWYRAAFRRSAALQEPRRRRLQNRCKLQDGDCRYSIAAGFNCSLNIANSICTQTCAQRCGTRGYAEILKPLLNAVIYLIYHGAVF